MKHSYLLSLSLILVACDFVNLDAYTWAVTNSTGDTIDVEVCVTPAIKRCIKQTINNNETKLFTQTWYNAGLCLQYVTVNGQKVNLNVKNRCTYANIALFKNNNGNFYSYTTESVYQVKQVPMAEYYMAYAGNQIPESSPAFIAMKCDKGNSNGEGCLLQRVNYKQIDPKAPLYAIYMNSYNTCPKDIKELIDAGKIIELNTGIYGNTIIKLRD